jgi:hypothetical protein
VTLAPDGKLWALHRGGVVWDDNTFDFTNKMKKPVPIDVDVVVQMDPDTGEGGFGLGGCGCCDLGAGWCV